MKKAEMVTPLRLLLIQQMVDFLFRIRNIARLIVLRAWSRDVNKSDTENRFYVGSVSKIVENPNKFKRFRRIYDYREILEHVSYELGESYRTRILSLEPSLLEKKSLVIKNDRVGKPRLYNYPDIGKISPTTLRYMSVLAELRFIFQGNYGTRIAEIGVGYGGQAAILSAFGEVERYTFFDLPPVLRLAEQYLSISADSRNNEFFSEPRAGHWDLVISNYAFSELPKDLQLHYVEKVLRNSKRGFMIMNSGRSNHTETSQGKLSLSEITSLLSGIEVLEEKPNTGKDNYIIVWGHKNQELDPSLEGEKAK